MLKRTAELANNINELGWETFGTAWIESRNMSPFQGIHQETELESDRGQNSKTMLFQ